MLVALVVIASLSALGALLVTALVVMPAATVRLWTDRLASWQAGTVALVAVEGTVGLWLSVQPNAPPGATIAVLAGRRSLVVAAPRGAASRRAAAAAAAGGRRSCSLGSACGSDGGSGEARVVATTTQIGDWAREVGDRSSTSTRSCSPNTDPHEYEPRPDRRRSAGRRRRDARERRRARRLVGEAAEDAGSEPQVVDLGNGLPDGGPARTGERSTPTGGTTRATPPPRCGALATRSRRRPASAPAAVRAATARYVAAIRDAGPRHRALHRRLPRGARKLVTDHDALGYFASRYGLEVVGTVIPAHTTVAQPSAGELAELARQSSASTSRRCSPRPR